MLRAKVTFTDNGRSCELIPAKKSNWKCFPFTMKKKASSSPDLNSKYIFSLFEKYKDYTFLIAGQSVCSCGGEEVYDIVITGLCIVDNNSNVIVPSRSYERYVCNKCGYYGESQFPYGIQKIDRIWPMSSTAYRKNKIERLSELPPCTHHWVKSRSISSSWTQRWFGSTFGSDENPSFHNDLLFFSSEEEFYNAVLPIILNERTADRYSYEKGLTSAFSKAMADGSDCWREIYQKKEHIVEKATLPCNSSDSNKTLKSILGKYGYFEEKTR